MKSTLVGYTGFVGENLCASHQFDYYFNSKNIQTAYGLKPDLLVYAGVKSEMFTANSNPDADMDMIFQAKNNIQNIAPKKLVLISTISVYDRFVGVNEDSYIDEYKLLPYGKNRLSLENWVKNKFNDSLIVRLPALYGKGIKKNFIYDIITRFVPGKIKNNKFEELMAIDDSLEAYYVLGDNAFYNCVAKDHEDFIKLQSYFDKVGFSAKVFTDSRSQFQFFNLSRLYGIINKALDQNIKELTITSEPVNASELYKFLFNEDFINEIKENYPIQNIRSKYAEAFGGKDGYFYNKSFVLNDIKKFVIDNIK